LWRPKKNCNGITAGQAYLYKEMAKARIFVFNEQQTTITISQEQKHFASCAILDYADTNDLGYRMTFMLQLTTEPARLLLLVICLLNLVSALAWLFSAYGMRVCFRASRYFSVANSRV
jgi:hypothetical protein